jgi:hypothetical protein
MAYSLHVKPNMYTTYGVQRTDSLAYLGFERSDRCPFLHLCKRFWLRRVPQLMLAAHERLAPITQCIEHQRKCRR